MRKRDDETAAIFARVPRAQAERLERASFELKQPKQEIIAGLLARHLPPEPDVGRHSFRPASAPDVMTLDQVADFLQVDAAVVEGLAATGELPARKLGDEWRFARQAILDWLAAK